VVGTNPGAAAVTVDPALKRAYYLSSGSAKIDAFDTDRMVRKESVTVPNVGNGTGSLVRLGGTALAFRTQDKIVVVPLKALK
jgi:hypothetical protein